ncbi:solute carrier family 35, member C2, partial [Phenoliferia sp. Uapishka_3]
MDAASLIREDTWASRGIGFNETEAVADIHHLHDETRRQEKGKGRASNPLDRDDASSSSSSDDMGWEPTATKEQAERRRVSGEAQYQYPTLHPNADLSSHHIQLGRRRSRSASVSSLDSRQRRIIWWKRAGINVLFIGAWYISSSSFVGASSANTSALADKWMFSEDHYNFRYPLFVTSIHMMVQWLLATLTLSIFKGLRPSNRPEVRDYGMKVVPCGMATGLDIGLSNLSLRSITLSFYTMCKSSSLAFVLLFAFAFKLETPSWRLAGIILIITSGVILMVSTETQFNFAGMVEVLSASALGGLRWSLTQILLDKESMGMGNPIATLFWLAPIMGVTLMTVSMIVDGWGNVFSQDEFFGSFVKTIETSVIIFIPGVIAFLMNVTEFGSVAGIFKEVAVIFLSMFIFHDQLTPINVSGLCVTIFGIALYNYLKYTQFTKGEAIKGHEATGHGSPKPGFTSAGEEDEPMLSPRARTAARLLGASNESAHDFHDSEFAAPLHSLGGSDSSSSTRSSIEVPQPSNLYDPDPSQHPLHRSTTSGKKRQHTQGRVEGLEESLFDADMELKEREVERSLETGITGHREAEDWDLLGQEEEPSLVDVRKKLA